MPNERKRLEAMSELFESEKTYVHDMKIWCSKFRRFFLNCQSISPQRRYTLNNLVFLNSENIAELHERIVLDMATRNEECRQKVLGIASNDIFQRLNLEGAETGKNVIYKDLEYTDIYEKYVDEFGIYQFFIERLPKIEFILDKELATNKSFAKDLRKFLTTTGYIVMGYKHFIFRPTQKLARYPLLLSAIAKNSTNDEVKDRVIRINDNLQEKTKRYDRILGDVKNAFAVYRLLMTLQYKDYVKNKIALGLFMKDRRLLQVSNEVYIRSKYRNEPRPFRVYLLDQIVIICDAIVKSFGEDLYIVDDPMPLIKYAIIDAFEDFDINIYFKDKFKFKLRELDGPNEVIMYFKTETQSNELFREIVKAREALNSKLNPKIELFKYKKLALIKCEDVVVNDPYYIGNSFSETEEMRVRSMFKESENNIVEAIKHQKKEDSPTTKNIENRSEEDIDVEIDEKNLCDIIKIEKSKARFASIYGESKKETNDFLLYTYPNGVNVKIGNSERRVLVKNVSQLQYINEFKIVCYIMEDNCYWSHFNKDTILIDSNIVCRKAHSYWYGKTLKTPYIIVRLTTTSTASYLHLFQVSNEKNILRMTLMTQLYIGATISQLIFFDSKLIVCCLDFEVVDMYSLNTHSLINPTDLTIEYFLRFEQATVARDVFKTRKGLYLTCSDHMGFFINQYGSFANVPSFFGWFEVPKEIKVFNDYLVLLTENACVVYDLNSGDVLRYIVKANLRFIKCSSTPWIHDGDYLYELKLPQIQFC